MLHESIRSLIALYLACGIDPKKNTIFIQSENIYHANMSWLLECNTPYGVLGRMTQFKDKSKKKQNFSAGLYTYPVLMASDILLYDADYVPTGQDQKQHVELARDIAIKINKKYNDSIFKVPEPLIAKRGAKIYDLVDPTKKMSKSSDNPKGVIYLMDDEKAIRKKIMSATTDSEMKIIYDPDNKPGISNLINIYAALTNKTTNAVEKQFKDSNYGEFKKKVADKVVKTLIPIQEKYKKLINSKELDKILDDGRDKTSLIAYEKYDKLKRAIGLYR